MVCQCTLLSSECGTCKTGPDSGLGFQATILKITLHPSQANASVCDECGDDMDSQDPGRDRQDLKKNRQDTGDRQDPGGREGGEEKSAKGGLEHRSGRWTRPIRRRPLLARACNFCVACLLLARACNFCVACLLLAAQPLRRGSWAQRISPGKHHILESVREANPIPGCPPSWSWSNDGQMTPGRNPGVLPRTRRSIMISNTITSFSTFVTLALSRTLTSTKRAKFWGQVPCRHSRSDFTQDTSRPLVVF